MELYIMKFLSKEWTISELDDFLVKEMCGRYGVCDLSSILLLNRGVDLENAGQILNPSLKTCMPDPKALKDINCGADLLLNTVLSKETICVMGDYDVDGMTSTAILYRYLSSIGAQIETYLPNRFSEGYGGTVDSAETIIKTKKPSLVIMVDNGSSSHDLVACFKQGGVKVIIIDHHVVPLVYPKADAFINPFRPDDESNLKYLCSAGLVFLFLVYLKNKLEESPVYKEAKNLPNLLTYLDLVALATVCDMVPLKGVNRAYVRKGLLVLQASYGSPGLKALLTISGARGQLNSETLGFTIGPAINAASRMGKQQLALELLCTSDVQKAQDLAEHLKATNIKRQQVENDCFKQAISVIERDELYKRELIFLGDSRWSKGLIGIIAGRIKETYNIPTCVYCIDDDGLCTASGRSVPDVHLGNIVLEAKTNGLLLKGGGHSQAVGFSFELSAADALKEHLINSISKQVSRNLVTYKDTIDSKLSLVAFNKNFLQTINTLEPYGVDFKPPVFLLPNVKITGAKIIGKNNNSITCSITDGVITVRAVCFKCVPSKLSDYLLSSTNACNVVVSVKADTYRGNIAPLLNIVDVAI